MIQSPSSILTYKQCPRKYYYQYILSLERKPNIHQVVGRVVHSVLENFFRIDLSEVKDYKKRFQEHILSLLKLHWDFKKRDLEAFNLSQSEKKYYFSESSFMLINWLGQFLKKIEDEMKKGFSFKESFKRISPDLREYKILSEKLMVQGYIDAVEKRDGKIRLMDYKTSKNHLIDETYKLQLAIYALLYKERYGFPPHKVGIYFLKHDEQDIDVDQDLLKQALFEIEQIHMSTTSKDRKDYPKKESGLCKWATGKCGFYDVCIKQRELSS